MRRVGLAVAGTLAAGLAVMSGTAFASSAAPAVAGRDGRHADGGRQRLDEPCRHDQGLVRGPHGDLQVHEELLLPDAAREQRASTRCEGGANYTQTPSRSFDPLYVLVPLGFTPPRSTLHCPVAGHCIDHPSTIDLSRSSAAAPAMPLLPPHSHIVQTANSGQPEWWNVLVVGVTSRSSWNKIVRAKSARELQFLQRQHGSGVTGNIGSNLFLFFSVR